MQRTHAFDVPLLVGNDIDQIKAMLGEPTDDCEPTQQQLELGTRVWSKTFSNSGRGTARDLRSFG